MCALEKLPLLTSAREPGWQGVVGCTTILQIQVQDTVTGERCEGGERTKDNGKWEERREPKRRQRRDSHGYFSGFSSVWRPWRGWYDGKWLGSFSVFWLCLGIASVKIVFLLDCTCKTFQDVACIMVEKRRWGHLKFEVRTKKKKCVYTLPYALKRGHKLTWKIEPTYDKNNGNYLQLPSQQIRFLIHLRQCILGDPKRCQLPSALIIFWCISERGWRFLRIGNIVQPEKF